MERDNSSEYCEVYNGQLQQMVEKAERLLDSGYPRMSIEQEDRHPPRIVHGLPAEGTGYSQLEDAQNNFAWLHTLAKISIIDRLEQMGEMDEAKVKSVSYDGAEQHTLKPTDELKIGITKLHRVDSLGEVTRYDFESTDPSVKQTLTIVYFGDQVIGLTSSLTPSDDELIDRWSDVLGLNLLDLSSVLMGQFDGEEDLDFQLDRFERRMRGRTTNGELATIIGEIRARALSTREHWHADHIASPSSTNVDADTLELWRRRLEQL